MLSGGNKTNCSFMLVRSWSSIWLSTDSQISKDRFQAGVPGLAVICRFSDSCQQTLMSADYSLLKHQPKYSWENALLNLRPIEHH